MKNRLFDSMKNLKFIHFQKLKSHPNYVRRKIAELALAAASERKPRTSIFNKSISDHSPPHECVQSASLTVERVVDFSFRMTKMWHRFQLESIFVYIFSCRYLAHLGLLYLSLPVPKFFPFLILSFGLFEANPCDVIGFPQLCRHFGS